ncbi:MAG: TRAP transporter large permease subunit, partial [Deltaproteobacteria bacterium]|jgi:tripartite ATP-independent transporter DctM subunit|nr:TRAP transporter large permease subunit [Deltaproteobacteria bacterium]
MLYYRELSFRDLLRVSAAAARTTAVVMLIVATASAVGYFITLARIPAHITTLFAPFIDSPFILLTIIMIFLLIAGMVMDLTPNILIFAPVFYPLIQAAGINEYHFGLLMVLNLGIGVITPPVGTVLYVVCGIGNIKLGELVTKMMPFVLMEIAILFLLVYFPQLSLAPLRWLM